MNAAKSSDKAISGIKTVGTTSKAAAVGAKALAVAGNMVAIALISWAANFAVDKINEYIHAFDTQIEKVEAAKSAYESSEAQVKSLESELSNIQSRIEELNRIESPTFVEQEELDRLKQATIELNTQLEAQKAIAEFNKGKFQTEFINTVKEYSDRPTFGVTIKGEDYDTGIEINDSKEEKANAAISKHASYIHSRNSQREQLAELLNVDESSRDAEAIEKALNQMQEYETKAKDSLQVAIDIYNAMSTASIGVERNEYTAPYFEIVDALGLAISQAQTFAGDINQLTGGFNTLWNSQNYTEATTALQKLAEEGKLAVESISAEPDISRFLSACEEIGISANQVVDYVNSRFANMSSDGTSSPTTTASSLYSSLFKNTEAYTKLTEAMNEQNEAGVLSFETYTALIEANSEFAELLELTAEGWTLNSEALWTFLEAQDEMAKGEALAHIQDLYEQLAENPDDAGIQSEIDRFAALIREIDSATGALAKFKAAQSTENQDADFGVGGEAYEVIKEGNKTGKIGTDDYKSAVSFMLGENWETEFAGNLDKAYKEAEKLGKRYFGQTDERTGMANFRDDVVKAGLGSFDGETFELFDNVTLEETADKLGMSYDAVKSMFGLMEAYGANFEFPFVLTDDDVKNIDSYKDKLSLDELKSAQEQVNEKAAEYQKTLETAKPGSEVFNEAQAGLEETTHAAQVLEQQIEKVSDSEVSVEPDTMTLEQLYQRLQELETAVTTLQNLKISVPTEILGDIETIKELINGREFTKYGKLEPTDNVTPKITEIENGDYGANVGVEANAGDLANTDSEINNVANKERIAYIKIVPDSTVDLEEGETIQSKVEGTGFTATKQDDGSYKWTDPISYFNGVVSKLATETGKVPSQDSVMAQYEQDVSNGLVAFGEATHNATDLISSALQIFTENAWANGPDGGATEVGVESGTVTIDKVDVESAAAEEATEIVQSEFDKTPIETDVEVEAGNIQETIEESTPEGVGVEVKPEIKNMSPEEIQAALEAGELPIDTSLNTATAEAQSATLHSNVETPANKPVGLDTSSADSQNSSLVSKLEQSVTKTVKIVYSGIRNSFATGTKNAPGGLSLVDDGTGSNAGPELVVHNKQGTYELGSGDGPRVTHLDKGDAVYTAKQTKSILAKAAKVGGFFRDGLNNARTIIGNAFATGVSGSMSWKKISASLSNKSGSSKKNTSSSSTDRNWTRYTEQLFDWIEIRLERLQVQTEKWMLAASEAIGFISKNNELDKALTSTSQQIEETTQAYQRYIEQANTVAQKTKLSADIITKIQNGAIDIANYNDDTKKKIEQYQEWWDKAEGCVEALTELREQERELATQKLDSILDHYQWRIDRLDAVVSSNDAMLGLKAATGIRIEEGDYAKSIEATTQKIQELADSRAALADEFADMVERGYITEGSELWYEYTGELENLDETIIETKTDLQDLVDAANNITLTNLQYAMDALENSAATMEQMMGLHEAQGADHSDTDYEGLIKNGMAQIKNLEAQNAELLKQQAVLEPLSEKYQELQEQIDGNNQSILDLKTSQEQWNDAVIDLKIGELEKYKEQLSKTNDEYQRQKELQQAIEDLERARSQRTQRVFRDGVGFVFEADQDAVLDAQRNLEDVVQNQLLGKLDDLIEALDDTKADTNVYDAFGVLLGKEYSLPDIGNYSELLSNFSKNTDIVTSAMEDAKKAAYEQVLKGVTNQNSQMSFQIGDIVIQNAKGPEDLANAILDNFPNAILQAMHSKT